MATCLPGGSRNRETEQPIELTESDIILHVRLGSKSQVLVIEARRRKWILREWLILGKGRGVLRCLEIARERGKP